MTAPEVSVVVGVRDGAERLRASLASVLAQEGVRLELIVVDDGSTDATSEVLAGLATTDPRVRIERQAPLGLTAALIHGCALARGAFIARHDADDHSLPGRLHAQAGRLRADPRLGLVSCWCRAVGPQGELLWEHTPSWDDGEATRRLLHERQGPPCHGSVMMRRAAYANAGGYRPEFYFGQDSDLWLRLAERSLFGYTAMFGYAFDVSENGVSPRHSRTQLRLGELGHACRAARLAGQPEATLLAEAARLRPGHAQRGQDHVAGAYFIGRCLLARHDPRARRYFLRVLRRRPLSVKAWLSLAHSLALTLR